MALTLTTSVLFLYKLMKTHSELSCKKIAECYKVSVPLKHANSESGKRVFRIRNIKRQMRTMSQNPSQSPEYTRDHFNISQPNNAETKKKLCILTSELQYFSEQDN